MFYASPRPRRVWSDRRILVLVALSTLIVSLIWRLPDELAYLGARMGELLFALTLSLAFTYVLRPGVQAIVKLPGFGNTPRGRSLATLTVFAGAGLVIYLMFLVGFRPVQRDVRGLVDGFWARTPQERTTLIAQWRTSFTAALEPYRSVLPADVIDDPNYLTRRAAGFVGQFGNWLSHQTAHLGFIVELLLVPVLTFYFLADGPAIRREAKLLVPVVWRKRLASMAMHFDYVLDGYVRGQAWMCFIAWVLVYVALRAAHIPHAMTLALIAGITRAVPVVGPLLGIVPLLFVCFFYTHSVQTTALLAFGFTMMHFLESKVLLPKIVGHHVDLHPVSVILSLLIGMEFFGFIGVFLAVPIAAVLKIILAEYHSAQEQKRIAENNEIVPIVLVNGNGASVSSNVSVSERAELQ